jgi:hypothetical protein
MMLFFWVSAPYRLSVDANVSEKHTVSIFRAEDALKMETVCLSETMASIDESTRCQNPEE